MLNKLFSKKADIFQSSKRRVLLTRNLESLTDFVVKLGLEFNNRKVYGRIIEVYYKKNMLMRNKFATCLLLQVR